MTLLGGIFFTSEEVRMNEDALFIIFLLILAQNTFFLTYWVFIMINCLIRQYASFFNKVLGFVNKNIKIDDYEANLKKYFRKNTAAPKLIQKTSLNSLSTPRLKMQQSKKMINTELQNQSKQTKTHFNFLRTKQYLKRKKQSKKKTISDITQKLPNRPSVSFSSRGFLQNNDFQIDNSIELISYRQLIKNEEQLLVDEQEKR
ncbi:UNKNOWN [Stylonychia lemnae]|uniref:Uncharacterized protein n=1 Tax=Stylonychia lemnae TaxID=5949 RepID=A0A078AQS7_STYLE|nr:UNKNOWN [Stylonychia lemnae]|eukprot:CDW84785.1 UNKNOWN [Stylonychia lemnae]